ncbi:hypothetical protein D9756_006225 [Leucocoprinus leucothites]|uniref:Uncharacterized protein n=1 Tax=Leucocoprinus leucothites TaxID=201217 RepID=A0A8H5FXX6_9AGAR|nr:hypothetical protein D9756_006225 [Leucoagaricus leucothites]
MHIDETRNKGPLSKVVKLFNVFVLGTSELVKIHNIHYNTKLSVNHDHLIVAHPSFDWVEELPSEDSVYLSLTNGTSPGGRMGRHHSPHIMDCEGRQEKRLHQTKRLCGDLQHRPDLDGLHEEQNYQKGSPFDGDPFW